MLSQILQNLQNLQCAPGVQFADVPKDLKTFDEDDDTRGRDPDTRYTEDDKRRPEGEHYEDDKDHDAADET